jgi:hypothetical protein
MNRTVAGMPWHSHTPGEQRHQLQACLAVLEPDDLQVRGIHIGTLERLITTKALGKMAPLVGILVDASLPKVKKDQIRRLRQEGHSIRCMAELTGVSASAVHKFCKQAGV